MKKRFSDEKRTGFYGLKKCIFSSKYREYLLIYTTLFALLFFICFEIWFQRYEKTFFRSFDGLDQHYLIFVYIGKWMRQIAKGILINHKLVIPLWNMGIGYGADILTSTGAYMPDPFNWLSIMIPTRFSEVGYAMVIVLKVYLSGLSYAFFCYHKGLDTFSTLMGALVYTFSGTMYIVFVESFFANPMIVFPLILVGADKLWKNEGSKLYVFSLALMFMNYFYFAYMTTILLIGYCIVRLFYERRSYSLKKTADLIMRFVYNSLISSGISMTVLLPILLVIIKAERLGVKYYNPLLYQKQYYIDLFSGFFSFVNMSYRDAYIGFAVISFLCIAILFIKRKNPRLKTIFIILSVGLCIPSFGVIMNGFSYYANRWCWAYALCIAYIVSITVLDLLQLNKKEKLQLVLCAVTYITLVTLFLQVKTEEFIVLSFVLVFSVIAIWFLPFKSEFNFKGVIITLTMITIIVPAYYRFNQNEGNFLKDWVEKNTAYSHIRTSRGLNYLKEMGINNEERYDAENVSTVRNASWIYGISGMDFYISIYNNGIDRFHNDMAMLTSPWTNGYEGLNARSELDYLMNVKYFVTNKESYKRPYAYEEIHTQPLENNIKIYENSINNSLIHGFNQVVEKKDVENYNPYYKQEILMQAPIVESINENDNTALPKLNSHEIKDITVKYSDRIKTKGNNINVIEESGIINITFDEIMNAELYVYLDNIDYFHGEESSYHITTRLLCKGDEISSKSLSLLNNRNHMYGGKHNWLVNMGIVEGGADQVILELNNIGHYKLDDIYIYAKPVSEIKNNIRNVPSIANEVTIEDNTVKYNIKDDSFRYMMVSIPYSSGWTAYVDGKKRDIRVCDEAFMLIDLKRGDRHVEMKYITPGLLPGITITVLSLSLYYFTERRRRYKANPCKEISNEIH